MSSLAIESEPKSEPRPVFSGPSAEKDPLVQLNAGAAAGVPLFLQQPNGSTKPAETHPEQQGPAAQSAGPAQQPEKAALPDSGARQTPTPDSWQAAAGPADVAQPADHPPATSKEKAGALTNVREKADLQSRTKKPGFTQSVEMITPGEKPPETKSAGPQVATAASQTDKAGPVAAKTAEKRDADTVPEIKGKPDKPAQKDEKEGARDYKAAPGGAVEKTAAKGGPREADTADRAATDEAGGEDSVAGGAVMSAASEGVDLEAAAAAAGQASTALSDSVSKASSLAAPGISFAPNELERDRDPDIADRGRDQRIAVEALANDFVSRNAGQLQTVLALGQAATPRITAAAAGAKAAIDSGIAQSSATLVGHFATVKAQARRSAAGTRGQIISRHRAATSTIRMATALARLRVQAAHKPAVTTLARHQANQLAALPKLYADGDKTFHDAGVKVGGEALKKSQDRSASYIKRKIWRDDSVLDGPLTDDRMDAMSNAVLGVGQEYNKGLIKAADDEAAKGRVGIVKDIAAVMTASAQSGAAIEAQWKGAIDGLAKAETQALAGADSTKAGMLKSVDGALAATIKAVDGMQAVELARLTAYGERQKLAIDRDSTLAAASLVEAASQAAGSLGQILEAFAANARATEAPDETTLISVLLEAQEQFDAQSLLLSEQLEKGVQASESGIGGSGTQSVEALTTLAQQAMDQASSTGDGFVSGMADLAGSAAASFAQLTTTNITGANETANTAVAAFTQINSGIETLFKIFSEGLAAGFKESAAGLEKGLREEGLKGLEADMNQYADEAYKQVQPRWKSVLKVLLVIAVIVVVALVAGPAVIGAVGAFATTLGAGAAAGAIGTIVGGAIVGAASGAVIQMGNNLIDNDGRLEGITKGVASAAAVGAIGGALGGVGSVLGKAAMGSQFVTKFVTSGIGKVAIDTAFNSLGDLAGNIVGDLATKGTVDWGGALTGAVIGLGVAGAMGGMGKLGKLAEAGKLGSGKLGAVGTKLAKISTGIGDINQKWEAKGQAVGTAAGGKVKAAGGPLGTKLKGPSVAPELPTSKGAAPGVAAKKPDVEAPAKAKTAVEEAPPAAKPAPEQPTPAKAKPEGPEAKPKAENEPTTTPKEKEILAETAPKKSLDLSKSDIDAELDLVAKAKPKPISEGDYVEEVDLGNGHKWKKNKNGAWCRHSNGDGCTLPDVGAGKTDLPIETKQPKPDLKGEEKLKPAAEVEKTKAVGEETEPAPKAEPETKPKSEVEEKAKAEADEKAKAETEEKVKAGAEEKTKAEAEEKAKAEAEAKTKAEAEEKVKAEAEEKAKAEAEQKAKAEAEEKAKAEAEEKAKAEAEEKAKAEAEEKAKAEAEQKAKAEAEQKAKAEAEEKAKAEAEEKAKAEAEAKAKAEAEEKAKAEAAKKAAADVDQWKKGLPTKSTPNNNARDAFEIQHTGSDNFQVSGGGEKVWADGVRSSDQSLLDAKKIDNPERSPYIPNSKCPQFIRQNAFDQVDDEFRRYAAVIADPSTPVKRLEVIVSDPNAKQFFDDLMTSHGIPGTVVVR